MLTPLSPSANMSQTEDRAKQLPQPATYAAPADLPARPPYDKVFSKFHQHTLSDSTNTTGSNESSPTTTISTVDDSSATEPSPGSSPESPPPTTFAVGMLRPRTSDDSRNPFFELQKQPPPKKGRNLKNLAVNTSRHAPRAASTTCLPLRPPADANASILSPSFVKPPTPPRRKPANLGLTILTPGGTKPPPQQVKLAIPPTPGFGRPATLRHFQSSPSLPLVTGLGLPRSHHHHEYQKQQALETIFSPIERDGRPQIEEEEEEEQNFDIPLSREEKPEAYPDGPVCVYDPHIDLYLEPTAEQAREYDVIMNVASEVRNPFTAHIESTTPAEPDLRLDGGGGIQYAPKRDRLAATDGNSGTSSGPDASPATPKATPLEATFPKLALSDEPQKDPEYIHIPWEHNSDIVPDLLRLVKLIDEKVSQGKRVLVHCQCGVSRSASLVVAYGLYKDPSMSVQEAYDAVKKRSKWIGPNMNLIMQLQEFRSSLARGGVLSGNRGLSPLTPSSAFSEWRGPFSNDSSSVKNVPLSAAAVPSTKAATEGDAPAISPGPSSAPSGVAWPVEDKQRSRTVSAAKPATAYVDPSGHVVPVLKIIEVDASNPRLAPIRRSISGDVVPEPSREPTPTPPRATEFAMAPLQPSEEVESSDSFGIMSPTSTEYTSNPFSRSALLATLGMGSMRADEETPRRSISLRNRERQQVQQQQQQQQQTQGQKSLGAQPAPRLRGKISSPTLREQQQLQHLQAQIEATLPVRHAHAPATQYDKDLVVVDDALMSPRATEFTSNPFALALSIPAAAATTAATSPGTDDSLRISDVDPRSPAHKGASPITRNIMDVL
ncbi:Tyrosine- phosphatase MSG5 [Lecanosticta acicola]|uniref:protein-tyrosine-phosphatase n=1 Tax=Lecanosticta acicola TaxID=111012 RepID=A0AAI8YXJ0_9PEZI|nr:Tyrosine- phosphatase MSG5 [Lecanosticta acicola]